jgi:hypothetical protein
MACRAFFAIMQGQAVRLGPIFCIIGAKLENGSDTFPPHGLRWPLSGFEHSLASGVNSGTISPCLMSQRYWNKCDDNPQVSVSSI